MKSKIIEYLVLLAIGTLLTTLGGWSSGYLQAVKASKEFFTSGSVVEAKTTLTALTASMKAATEHETEIEQLQMLIMTKTGDAEIFQTDRTGALVSSRSPFKRSDRVQITNISSDETRSTEATITGDFTSRDENLLLRVSPDIAKILGFSEGKIRVEIKPIRK